MTDICVQFCQAILAAGLCPPSEILPDGKLHRFASNGDPADDAGWYIDQVSRELLVKTILGERP